MNDQFQSQLIQIINETKPDLEKIITNIFSSTERYQSWAVFKYIIFKYIYCIYTLYLNTFFYLYLITVFKYFSKFFTSFLIKY